CLGRLELFHNGSWGTVCDDGFDLRDAAVACRQLGCGDAISVHGGALFGEGTGPVFLDELACTGDEASLAQCSHQGLGIHNCRHKEDASVVCADNTSTRYLRSATGKAAPQGPLRDGASPSASPDMTLRLVDGDDPCLGRLELFHNGSWGTVCDDGFDLRDAAVACRQLGCG
ncbi:DMBT1 protein, partial [Crypturellus undulatus]|nr:DMBT1 protein [Crypturellus undulatus]